MTVRQPPASVEDGAIATVIPLLAADRGFADEGVSTADDPLTRARRWLERHVGDRGLDIPPAQGRFAAEVEKLLEVGPCDADWSALEPGAALANARKVLRTTLCLIDLISDETDVLAEVMSTDLNEIPLDDLHDVVAAAVELDAAPRPATRWADPRAADAADLALGVVADDLRAAARLHESLYERFTERVWRVPTPLLKAGRRRWRLFARVRLRGQLGAASRSERVGSIAAAATTILEVRAARERIDALAPLLTHHLAELDHGPLTDVNAALEALQAVRRLQSSLGTALDHGRLEQLLAADAFRSRDVVHPALHVRTAVRAWRADIELAGGAPRGALSLDQLAAWADTIELRLAEVDSAYNAALGAGMRTTTLRSLVEILLVREHLEDLMTESNRETNTNQASSAS